MDWQKLFVVPHTLRADYQSLPQAQLCLYNSLIFRNSVTTEPQSLHTMFSATFEITPASSNLEFTTLSASMKNITIHDPHTPAHSYYEAPSQIVANFWRGHNTYECCATPTFYIYSQLPLNGRSQ